MRIQKREAAGTLCIHLPIHCVATLARKYIDDLDKAVPMGRDFDITKQFFYLDIPLRINKIVLAESTCTVAVRELTTYLGAFFSNTGLTSAPMGGIACQVCKDSNKYF